ncbi:MAG TPA: SigE family RNA polymerase sigma factor [Streptosporangiaceae bacterium]|nr:SigE family RNA polymerase sigma factor [Streptosporangiaceae bacterium]
MDLLAARRAAAEEPATIAVTALYAEHALGLTRLAQVMLGDRGAAEDVVQDAFTGLYRRWSHLADSAKAPSYLRSAVLNGCRSVLRRAGRAPVLDVCDAIVPDSESAVLASQARQDVLRALRRLPDRQREVLVLRYYLDLKDGEIAAVMGIRDGSVRSAAHRGLAALERILGKEWL